MTVGAQPGLGDRLVAAALEVLGQPQDHRAAIEQPIIAGQRERLDLAQLRDPLAVVTADLADQRALAGIEARQLGALDQIPRVLVVVVIRDRHADVVEHRGGPQQLALAVSRLEQPAADQRVEHLQ